ncbi:hypothetical protein D3M59_11850 [Sphingomonas edaphi]|uniref:Uncharacterized protein n=1 Tax=Sphingomonas edaphi TaxID=2315689 RepID=A0A418PY79_9SPHN|nr:hypothetical protein D3M59_11850 [Sphingomonas edaphi]
MPDCLVPVRPAPPAPLSLQPEALDWTRVVTLICELAALADGEDREALLLWARVMEGAAALSCDQS